MPRILTRRKEKWVQNRKPQIIRGTPLNNPSILEARFSQRLEEVVTRMCDQVDARLKRFFNEPQNLEYVDQAMDDSISSQARMLTNALMRKFNSQFAALAPTIAESQMNAVNKASSSAVHGSLKELSGGLSLPTAGFTSDMDEILNASTVEMVSLIKSISVQYLGGVQQAVSRSIASGRGLLDLQKYLDDQKGITTRRARMIAHDQTRKAYNNLNRGRMQKLGLTSYEWLHTAGSSHPRELHKSYSGKIFRFDDPPVIDERTGERGIPGQAINCRCRMVAVLDFSNADN